MLFIISLLTFFTVFQPTAKIQKFERELLLMGSRFEIIVVDADSVLANRSIEAAISEIKRIENLISSWKPTSQTSLINENAGLQPVLVDLELFQLIERSLKVSRLTHGVFDISFASLEKIWRFDGSMNVLPDSDSVRASVKNVNYKNIILDQKTKSVFLKNKHMKIGFGAIGKGYAANRAREVMQEMGIFNGVVNAGGDLISWGKQQDGKPWQIAVTDPVSKHQSLGWIDISNTAVVTSGNYEKYVLIDDIKYSHIINPITGYPAHGTRSVTVFCPDAELADALATATFILGKKKGLELINKIKGVECLIVTEADELIYSSGLELLYH